MGTVTAFNSLLSAHGSDAVFHRDESTSPCPCLTAEGFRDPQWHDDNPLEPVCNERGFLPAVGTNIHVSVKAFIQPSQSTRATRLTNEFLTQLFGVVQTDDHIGIFPEAWGGTTLNFHNWSQSGEDYVEYNGRKFFAVSAHLIPDPSDGNPRHHWEVGLRLMGEPL